MMSFVLFGVWRGRLGLGGTAWLCYSTARERGEMFLPLCQHVCRCFLFCCKRNCLAFSRGSGGLVFSFHGINMDVAQFQRTYYSGRYGLCNLKMLVLCLSLCNVVCDSPKSLGVQLILFTCFGKQGEIMSASCRLFGRNVGGPSCFSLEPSSFWLRQLRCGWRRGG